MQTKHANYVFAERQHAKQHINPIDVMDEALYFIHNIIDLNVELQELIIEIRKKLVQRERSALSFLHHSIRKAETLRIQFTDKVPKFCAVEESGLVGFQYQAFNDRLFQRFNGRVSEKIFKKFLYYSMNSKSLQFMTESLLTLYQINQEITEGDAGMLHSFEYFKRVVQFVLEENRSLIELLLELIVEANFVSSLDEFFILNGIQRVERDGVEIFQHTGIVINPQQSETSSEEEFASPRNSLADYRRKRHKKRHGEKRRQGKYFQDDFKNQLDSMMVKYQDARIRQDFLTVLSKSIRKEFDILEANPEQEVIYKRFRLRNKERASDRWMEQNRKSRASRLTGEGKDEAGKKNKTDAQFFVGTYANALSKTVSNTAAKLVVSSSSSQIEPKQQHEPFQLLEELEKWKPQTSNDGKRKHRKTVERNQTLATNPIKPHTPYSRGSTKPSSNANSLNRRNEREQFREYFEDMLAHDELDESQHASPPDLPKNTSLVYIPRNINRFVEKFNADLEGAVESLIEGQLKIPPAPMPISEHINVHAVMKHLNQKVRMRNIKSAESCRVRARQSASRFRQHETSNCITSNDLSIRKPASAKALCHSKNSIQQLTGRLHFILSGYSHPKLIKPELEPAKLSPPKPNKTNCRRLVRTNERHWRELYHTGNREFIPLTIK